MKQLHFRFLLLVITAKLVAFQTSSESVNPFNQFMAPSGGCDLYSGNAAFSIPLISLQGFNGTDVQVGLSYSSNVTVNSRSMNKYGPTSWVGLGWSLQFGSIKCDHKGTTTHDDDEFYYVAGAGSVNRLIKPNRLKFWYYEGAWSALPNFNNETAVDSGKCSYFNIRRTDKNDNYAFVFKGQILLHNTGKYIFHSNSDDGCKIYIDDTLVNSNDFIHNAETEISSDSIFKTAGYHTIKVEYFQNGFKKHLLIRYTPPDGIKRIIPMEDLRAPDIKNEDLDKKFYVENSPYLKCDPFDFDGDGIYDYWKITNTDGTRMIFGKIYSADTSRNATRYTFSQNGFVGTVTYGNPDLYPYQWDLRAVINNFGDTVHYKYQQEKVPIQSNAFKSYELGLFYTKASYPQSIVSTNGKHLKFELEDKQVGNLEEPYDPYKVKPEPDGFMEMYESKRLKRIRIYSPEISTPMKTIEITYDFLNQNRGNEFLKSMLKSITWINNKAGVVENRYNFEYMVDSTRVGDSTGYNPDYHYGAIKSITDFDGTETEYSYTQNEQDEYDSTYYPGDHESESYALIKNAQLRIHRRIQNANGGPWIHGDNGILLHSGTYDNGKEYILILGGKKHDQLWLYTFDGHNWVLDKEYDCKHFDYTGNKTVQSFDNGFLYKNSSETDDNALLVFWQNGKWSINNIVIEGNGDHLVDVHIGNDFLVCRGGNGDRNLDRLWIYRRTENEWLPDRQFFGTRIIEHEWEHCIATGANFFTLVVDGLDTAMVIRWDGNRWVEKGLKGSKFRKVYASNNYFVIIGGENHDLVSLYYWNGVDWELDPYYNGMQPAYGNSDKKVVYATSDYFVVKSEIEENKDQIWIVSFTGNGWVTQQIEKIIADGQYYVDVYPGPDFIVFRGGDASTYEMFRLYRKKNIPIGMIGDMWKKDSILDWVKLQDENGKEIGDEFSVVAGNGSFAITTTGKTSPDHKMHRWIYRYDGSKWGKIFSSSTFSRGHNHEERKNGAKNRYSLCATSGGYGFSTMVYDGDWDEMPPPEWLDIEFVHRFQDNYNDIKSYVVSQKKNISLSTAETLATTYQYEDSHFDATIGSLKFNKVSVIAGNNGRTVNHYLNDTKIDGLQYIDGYTEMDGLLYWTETYNADSQLVSESKTEYNLHKDVHWPDHIQDKRLYESINGIDGVYDTTANLIFNDYGAVLIKEKKMNNNGKDIHTFTDYAYELYPDLKNRYMVSQPFQTIVMEGSRGSCEARSSQANTWHTGQGLKFASPCSSFVWNAECDTNGAPVSTYVNFPFRYSGNETILKTHKWDYSGSIEKYSSHGVPLEKIDKSGKRSSIKLGTARQIPIGTADNSSYQDLAIFTCDYKIGNSLNWWDSAQGWERCDNTSLVNDSTHFGQKSIRFNYQYAVRRNNPITPGKSYIMSAWVKITWGSVLLKTDFRHSTIDDREAWPSRTLQIADTLGKISDSMYYEDCKGTWQYMKIEIPASLTSRMDPDYDWYACAWIGKPEGSRNYVLAHIDDIRFYPKDAHVSTTYYDTLHFQPILTVDENNNPGMMVRYDLQGRPFEWYKTNKHDPLGKTLVMKKDYHIFGQTVTP